jgi:hypothetical protein
MLCMSQDWPLCQRVSHQEGGVGGSSHNISTEMDAEKFDDEFSLMATLSSNNKLAELEDSGTCFMDNGSSHHMTG